MHEYLTTPAVSASDEARRAQSELNQGRFDGQVYRGSTVNCVMLVAGLQSRLADHNSSLRKREVYGTVESHRLTVERFAKEPTPETHADALRAIEGLRPILDSIN